MLGQVIFCTLKSLYEAVILLYLSAGAVIVGIIA